MLSHCATIANICPVHCLNSLCAIHSVAVCVPSFLSPLFFALARSILFFIRFLSFFFAHVAPASSLVYFFVYLLYTHCKLYNSSFFCRFASVRLFICLCCVLTRSLPLSVYFFSAAVAACAQLIFVDSFFVHDFILVYV